MKKFRLVSDFTPKGDQPKAIKQLSEGIKRGERLQTLLGTTGSGKTFSMSKVIEEVQRPTLVISHNKTLAAQLYEEFKEFFPNNAVEYFVSYYDYFQPEAYVPRFDLYVEKETDINQRLEMMRLSAIQSLSTRRDVIVVASVSCIFGAGVPEVYRDMRLHLEQGAIRDRDEILRTLVKMQYTRSDIDFQMGRFRVRGDVLDIFPAYDRQALRTEWIGDEIERITNFDPLTGKVLSERKAVTLYPARHFLAPETMLKQAIKKIEKDLEVRVQQLEAQGKQLEAHRLKTRTRYDLEMLREVGNCTGIENYSLYFDGRKPGDPPLTLLNHFPSDYLIFIDESHVTLPQLRGMYRGNKSRKDTLVEYGFRLPTAVDNRPLKFAEFMERVNQVVFVSATPAKYEREKSSQIVEQIVRPTGLVDPEITMKPVKGQVDDLLGEIRTVVGRDERVLVTTLTKKNAEDLAAYLAEAGVKARYLHSEVDTLERVTILRDLRLGMFNVLVGINLLREGLDLPEVSLVAILDADKEGFLRHEVSLIQTMGRASRNVHGKVILYADEQTESMRRAVEETNRRRSIQMAYNKKHNIIPETIRKPVRYAIQTVAGKPIVKLGLEKKKGEELIPIEDLPSHIITLEKEMHEAADNLEFERAAELRDKIRELKSIIG